MTLPYGLTPDVLAAAESEPDPESLPASTRLRRHWPAELVAAAVTQVVLRRRATTKFGPDAASMFFTRDGLEQATRPAVAAHHAARFVAAGARRVVDLGCGIGTDAYAFAAAGLEVVAVERDPATAEVARANLPPEVEVVAADAETVRLRADDAVFCDPARRTGAGRSWRVEDLSPSWDFVSTLLNRPGPTGVKLGPGFPRPLIPDLDAEWVQDAGDLVELGLWTGPARRSAYATDGQRLVVDPAAPGPEVAAPQAWLHVPAGAVTQSGALPTLATRLGSTRLHPDVAYLSGPTPADTPFAESFEVQEQFAFRERDLKTWVTRNDVGRMEILTRGLDLDPATLRRRLRLRGSASVTIVITRVGDGKSVLLVERQQGFSPRSRPDLAN